MSYYHVRISTKTDPSKIEVELDVHAEELDSRFLEPYRLGRPIVISGKTVTGTELERIQITETLYDSNSVNREIRAKDKENSTIRPVDTHGRLDPFILSKHGIDVTKQYIAGPPGHAAEPHSQPTREVRPATSAREVFVVHGRNLSARDALFEFLRSLDLYPLEWSESVAATGKPLPYIGEILDAAFSFAHAVVVLFTPDDESRLREQFRIDSDPPHETQLTGQARPNVLFEAGMAMARDQNRTVLIELGDLRPFSDIAGLHTIRLNDTPERRQELAQRLRAAGCPVNTDGTDWYTAGDFEGAVAEENDNLGSRLERPPQLLATPQISDDARELLLDAARSADDTIMAFRVMAGLGIKTRNRSFVEPGDRRSEARWKRALEELEQTGLIEALSYKREAFQLTHAGFAMADSLNEGQKAIQPESP